MLLQYLRKLKIQISADIQPIWKKMQAYCILIASNFVTHPQMLILSVLKNGVSFLRLIANKIFMSLFFFIYLFAINLWHRKFVTADVTAMFVNNQHGIQWQGQYFNKKFVFEVVHSKEFDRRISCGVNKLFKPLRDTGTVDRRPGILILISQGSAATRLKWVGYCGMGFVANFIRFPAMQKVWKSVKIWQNYREYIKVETFWDTV